MHSWLELVMACVPLLHTVAEVAPAKQKWPAGQSLHCALLPSPATPLYVPAGHGTHAPAADLAPVVAPNVPALASGFYLVVLLLPSPDPALTQP